MKPYEHEWHKPGVVAFCTSGWPRTEDFWMSLNAMYIPNGTLLSKHSGVGIATMMNMSANLFMEDKRYQWMWITGDDHVWAEDLVPKMINRAEQYKCDVLVPLVCRKVPPFDSVLFLTDRPCDFQDLPMQDDPIPVFRAGTGGMLIQRRVFEKMAENPDIPPFKGSGSSPDQVGEDIHFCDLAQSLGFRIWVDPTLSIGHSPYGVSMWPYRDKEGKWWLQILFPENKAVLMPLERPERVGGEPLPRPSP
jgi:GT2 family glycosyltransferase